MYKTLSLKNEILRKTIHVFNSLIPISLCLFRQDYITIGVGVALAVWLLLEFFRLSNKKAKSIYRCIFGRVTREFEDSSLTGATYVLLSSFIILIFFSIFIISSSLSLLLFTDRNNDTTFGLFAIKSEISGARVFFEFPARS